jgi:uncharacterized membrane protein YqjE
VGLGGHLTRLAAGSILLVRQRLELASLEIEEELLRLGVLLAGALVTALMLGLALLAAGAAVVIYFWDAARMTAAIAVTLFFALAAAFGAWWVACGVRDKPGFLAASLAELHKDAERLKGQP